MKKTFTINNIKYLLLCAIVSLSTVTGFGQSTIYSQDFGSGSSFPSGWSSPTGVQWAVSQNNPSSGYTNASGGSNVRGEDSGDDFTDPLIILLEDISTVGFNSITVIWGANKESGFPDVTLEWSADGSPWDEVTFTDVNDDGTWALVNGGTNIALPEGAENISNLRLRWTFPDMGAFASYRIDDVLIEGVSLATDYYSKSSGDLGDLSTWGTNTDGSGANPPSFTANGQTFNVVNQASPTISSNWTVSGTSSKVVVGNGTDAINFSVPDGLEFAGEIDVRTNATLSLLTNTYPSLEFGKIDNGTVNYARSGNQNIIPWEDYGNVTIILMF